MVSVNSLLLVEVKADVVRRIDPEPRIQQTTATGTIISTTIAASAGASFSLLWVIYVSILKKSIINIFIF